jgi:hypothetical protein
VVDDDAVELEVGTTSSRPRPVRTLAVAGRSTA